MRIFCPEKKLEFNFARRVCLWHEEQHWPNFDNDDALSLVCERVFALGFARAEANKRRPARYGVTRCAFVTSAQLQALFCDFHMLHSPKTSADAHACSPLSGMKRAIEFAEEGYISL
jgi:hypothetical protein